MRTASVEADADGDGRDVVGRVLVGVADDQAGRGEGEHRDVATQLVAVEGGLVVHDVGRDRLARQRGLEGVGDQVRVVPGPLDV